MTKPMMSIEDVKKADALIGERSRIAAARWNGLTYVGNDAMFQTRKSELADEQLQWAIEQFRKRKLDEIDAQLRELGVDPSRQNDERITAEPVGELTAEPVSEVNPVRPKGQIRSAIRR